MPILSFPQGSATSTAAGKDENLDEAIAMRDEKAGEEDEEEDEEEDGDQEDEKRNKNFKLHSQPQKNGRRERKMPIRPTHSFNRDTGTEKKLIF